MNSIKFPIRFRSNFEISSQYCVHEANFNFYDLLKGLEHLNLSNQKRIPIHLQEI